MGFLENKLVWLLLLLIFAAIAGFFIYTQFENLQSFISGSIAIPKPV